MASNWITLTGTDLLEVVALEAIGQTNANVTDSATPGAELDPAQPNRRDLLVAGAVEEVRRVIQAAGRVPVSVTPATIPPEAKRQTLVLAAYRMIASTPSLSRSFLIMEPGGGPPPLKVEYDEAKLWLYGRLGDRQHPGIAGGANVTPATDPVGRDGINAVKTDVADTDPAYNPLYEAVRVGSVGTQGQVDLAPFMQNAVT